MGESFRSLIPTNFLKNSQWVLVLPGWGFGLSKPGQIGRPLSAKTPAQIQHPRLQRHKSSGGELASHKKHYLTPRSCRQRKARSSASCISASVNGGSKRLLGIGSITTWSLSTRIQLLINGCDRFDNNPTIFNDCAVFSLGWVHADWDIIGQLVSWAVMVDVWLLLLIQNGYTTGSSREQHKNAIRYMIIVPLIPCHA